MFFMGYVLFCLYAIIVIVDVLFLVLYAAHMKIGKLFDCPGAHIC